MVFGTSGYLAREQWIQRVNIEVPEFPFPNFRAPNDFLRRFYFFFSCSETVPVRSIEIDWFEQARLICLEKKCFYQEIWFLVLQDVLESVVHTRCEKMNSCIK